MLINNNLSKSIVFKYHLLAIEINKRFEEVYNIIVDTNDISEFPHYKNLQGLPHELNNPIVTNDFASDTKITLTKESLHNEYTDLLVELRKCGEEYDKLMGMYKNDGTYIHGMIFPVSKEKILNSSDGTILAYNQDFVERNEVSLLSNLESSLDKFLFSNSNPQYLITDDLYATIVFLMASTFITSEIARLRCYTINTFEAPKAYKLEKLNSHFRLGAYATRLNEPSLLWLYKNIDFLTKNIGKNITLDMLTKEIVIANGLSLDKVTVNSLESKLLKGVDITKPPVSFVGSPTRRESIDVMRVETDYIRLVKNTYDSKVLSSSPIHTDYLRTLEAVDNPNGRHPSISNNDLYHANSLTKDILLRYDSGRVNKADIVTIVLESCLLFIHDNNKPLLIEAINGAKDTIRADALKVTYLALLLELIGGDRIGNVSILSLLNKSIPDDKLTSGLTLSNDFNSKIKNMLLPIDSNYGDVAKNQITTMNVLTQVYNNNKLNTLERADIEIYARRLKGKQSISFEQLFNGKTIKDLKSEYGVSTPTTIEDKVKELAILSATITGISILESSNASLLLKDIKTILSRLTSYTVQILVDNNENIIIIDKPFSNGVMLGDGFVSLGNGTIELNRAIPELGIITSSITPSHKVTYSSSLDTTNADDEVYGIQTEYVVHDENNSIVTVV